MAAGEGLEPSLFGFKARRVTGYTIPQQELIVSSRFASKVVLNSL